MSKFEYYVYEFCKGYLIGSLICLPIKIAVTLIKRKRG
jgi:hypothetical protein